MNEQYALKSNSTTLSIVNGDHECLTTTRLVLLCIASIISIRSLPMMAGTGMQLIFFYSMAAIFYLIPSAMIYAELASTWPKDGGIYHWSKSAFGYKAGILTIWSEWFNNTIGCPITLSFLATALAYLIDQSLINNKLFIFLIMLLIIWLITLLNFTSIKISTILNVLGAWFGILIPVVLITFFGIVWLNLGHVSQVTFKLVDILPPLKFENLVFLLGVFSSYAGMQILGFHTKNIAHPAQTIPKIIAMSVGIIITTTIFGALCIAIVVPPQQLTLVNGVFEGFSLFLNKFHFGMVLPIVIIMLIIGGLSLLSSWFIGPARGLSVAATDGMLPKFLATENKNGMPVKILIIQAIIASSLSSLFLFASSISAAFWLLMVLTSQFTMVMDILIFTSAIRLRHTHPSVVRPYKVFGGKLGIWLIAGSSSLICAFTYALGFVPPVGINIGSLARFETTLIVGNICYIAIPFAFIYIKT